MPCFSTGFAHQGLEIMKRIYLAAFAIVIAFAAYCQPGSGKIVFLEHSIRWMNESNFPYYLKLPEVEASVLTGIKESLREKMAFNDVLIPEKVDYRVIDMFGKSKVKWPKKPDPVHHEVAILSSLSRDQTGVGIFWTMEVIIRKGTKETYAKSVVHELEPISYSCYLTKQRWFDAEEFSFLFLDLFDEALGLRDPLPAVIPVGSYQAIEANVHQIMPVNEKYHLAIAGGMMQESNATYQLRKDNNTLKTFYYREGSDMEMVTGRGMFSVVLTELFNSVTGIRLEFDLKTKVQKRGRLESDEGEKSRLNLMWLQRKNENTIFDESVQFVSPVLAEMYDSKKDVYASFIYYKKLNTNGEELSKKNFRLTGSRGTLGVSDVHFVTGKLHGKDFEIVYPEQDGMVIIYMEGSPVAVLTMYNENNESRSFAGQRISKNKKVVTGSSSVMGRPNAETIKAEIYSLYASADLDPQLTEESVKLCILLFFSIAQTLGEAAGG
jgi:hypothetical protein